VRSVRQLLSNLRSRPTAHLAVVFVAVSNPFTFIAVAATPTVLAAPALPVTQSVCSAEGCVPGPANAMDNSRLSLPKGLRQCQDSGPAAACANGGSPADYVPGTPAAPAGQVDCPIDAKTVPATPAACSNAVLPAVAPARNEVVDPPPIVQPSLPVASLGTRIPSRLALTTNAETVPAHDQVVLTATASSTVTGTDLAIEIFDTTSGTLIGACGQGSQCAVAYSAMSGAHDFAAYLTPPTTSMPDAAVASGSNRVSVGWLDSSISASGTLVGQGQSITLTATSTIDVQKSGRWLEIYDLTTDSRITYCSRGNVCTTSIKETTGGVHEIVGYVNGAPEAVSAPIFLTWLDVSLAATSVGPKIGGTIYLKATTNADLEGTPWVVGIYDERGRLVDHACKTGNTCSVQAWMSDGPTSKYTAMVGTLPEAEASPAARTAAATALLDVQAKSSAVEPTHLLWGVDSCKAFVGDPTGNLYSKVVRHLGAPDFWGRYLTNTVCPGISPAEVALAAAHHMGILPIYNDYNCSAVVYYATGQAYANQAVAAAQRIGIPKGRLLAIDIEPPGAVCPGAGRVDAGFIQGWYDGVSLAGYVPVYYGNGTRGSEFARAWCTAVRAAPNIAAGSDLWSFQPSLSGRFNKAKAPAWRPYNTGCPGNMEAWQYVLSAGNSVDVDQDEALSSLPLWYP
jgi:hypothetical protein